MCVRSLALLSGLRIQHCYELWSCGVCHRCGSDATLLWLWHRPAAAALIPSLAWELPNVGVALKKKMMYKNSVLLDLIYENRRNKKKQLKKSCLIMISAMKKCEKSVIG